MKFLFCSTISESSLESSIEGKYRNVTESDSVSDSNNNVTELEAEPVEEPKKERERFRDKMKGKFKLKSNKTPPAVQEQIDLPKEVADEEYFGCSLESVEKDTEHKNVPKVVVDCVEILEDLTNLSTPGIYRVSGEKNEVAFNKKKIK